MKNLCKHLCLIPLSILIWIITLALNLCLRLYYYVIIGDYYDAEDEADEFIEEFIEKRNF